MNSPYSIFPIGILSLVFYLFTYLMARIGMIQLSFHRKVWNILLLITFLVTAFLGLFLAVQVNYKIKLAITDTLLVWHVDFGIGMAMIAIFHLLWHLDYYLKLLSNGKRKNESALIIRPSASIDVKVIENKDRLPVFALGMTALITQVILIREFVSVFQGNELIIGIILANWMILTGLGAYLGRSRTEIKKPAVFIYFSLIITGVIPIIAVILLNTLKNLVFPVGTMIGIPGILICTLILLIPFCLFSGFLFTFYAKLICRKYNSNLISKVYATEAAGSLFGGIIYSFGLIYFLQSLQTLALVLLTNFIIATAISGKDIRRIINYIVSLALIIVIATVFILRLDLKIRNCLFRNQEILYSKDTPFGNLTVTESAGQKNFFDNSVLLFSTDNIIGNEETVHFPMLQHSSPKNVLLIGGGIAGLTQEILKYKIERLDYVEINPRIFEIGKKFTVSLEDSLINTVNQDPRLFLQENQVSYDVIIINMPAPGSLQVNRYFTLEFFNELKNSCEKNAVISLSLPSTENYVSDEARRMQSVVLTTLFNVFSHVLVIPGEKNYFIASDYTIDPGMGRLSDLRNISNVYVNRYYMDDAGLSQRSEYIMKNLSHESALNKDFVPVAYFMETGYWMSYFRFNYELPLVIIIIIAIILLVRMNTVNTGLFVTGFSSSSIEILLIFAFQVIYGYVYHAVGIIITVFMAGLAFGAMYRNKNKEMRETAYFWRIQFMIALFSLLFPAIIYLMHRAHLPVILVYLLFFMMTLAISILTGMQFSVSSRIQQGTLAEVSSSIYSADLIGSAVGALLVSVFLLPLIGMVNVFILLVIINLIASYLGYRNSLVKSA